MPLQTRSWLLFRLHSNALSAHQVHVNTCLTGSVQYPHSRETSGLHPAFYLPPFAYIYAYPLNKEPLKTHHDPANERRTPAAYTDRNTTAQGISREAVKPSGIPAFSLKRKAVAQLSPTRALPLAGGIPDDDPEVRRGNLIQVGGQLGTFLETGSTVILLIKQILLPYGSGNVTQSIEGSRTQSITRLTSFRNMSYLDPEMKKPPVTVGTQQIRDLTSTEQIVQAALAAALVQGGNCLQNGEISYALLNLMLPSGTPIALIQPGGCDHAFTVIGDVPSNGPVTKDMAQNMVCVDAWPHVAKACLLSDSAFGTWKNAYVVKGAAKGGGKAGPFFEQLEEQRRLVREFSDSTTNIKDRDLRAQRNNLRTALRNIEEHHDRTPDRRDFDGAFDNMTIFKNDVVPEYITPSHPDFNPDL